jgi:hypothetical protein
MTRRLLAAAVTIGTVVVVWATPAMAGIRNM